MRRMKRSPSADVVLDHPSISRQHAAVCYQRGTARWALLDLHSVHGTTLDGRPVSKVRVLGSKSMCICSCVYVQEICWMRVE
jgi:pSer/pThr/pTyr-binding forkhead associated (FHA) protein